MRRDIIIYQQCACENVRAYGHEEAAGGAPPAFPRTRCNWREQDDKFIFFIQREVAYVIASGNL
jgi:hypothetical protein